jgi:type IV pilus assembly protein PilM
MPFFPQVFKNKFSKEKFSLGLDIGTSEIKLIKLKLDKDARELCGFAIEPFQDSPLAALKKIAEAETVKKVNISVSGPSAIVRYINLPRMTTEELRQSLKFEVEKHIPFPASEVNTDASILKSDLPDNKMLVLIAAVKKEFLNQRIKLIEEAGFKVNAVDIDSLAIINAFNFSYPQGGDTPKAVGLLNIGASYSNLNILEGIIPRLSRDIHIAGNNFTQKISDFMNLDNNAAEALKINPDREHADKLSASINTPLSQLAGEIRTSFDYYESQSASSVVKIFLSGGAGFFPGLKDSLANMLGIEVEHWDPLKRLNLSGSIDAEGIKAASLKLAVAAGLSLRF